MKLGFGGAPIAGLYAPVDRAAAMSALDAAQIAGMTHIDTAPLYGHGLGETRIGEWLALQSDAKTTLSTKVGRLLTPGTGEPADDAFIDAASFDVRFDYSAYGIEQSFAASCDRLGVDRVDTLLLHDIGAATHGAAAPAVFAQAINEALPAMRRLQREGRVRRIGLGVNEWQVAAAVLDCVDLDVILLAGRYTLLDRSGAALLDLARGRGVEIWVAGVFNSGMLAGGETFDYRPASNDLRQHRDRLMAISARYGLPLTAAAIQFAARHPAVTLTIIGLRSPAEVAAAVADAHLTISDDVWSALEADA